uniref:Smr domain-containing protein n=1 Tax=Globisporangium ultimum (strain ATCC 200006 / CBS 805.95 / DAOM BR144) TaxID=431595 RepID=K3W5L9_GLOUD
MAPSTVDLVLEMTATYDADGFQEPSRVTRSDVVAALLSSENDVASAVDEILSLIAAKSLQIADTAEQHDNIAQQKEAQLQWHELCTGLGVSECDAFMKALDDLPDEEKDAILSNNGGFLQQLLLELDETEQQDEREEQHPLEKLQALYPDYSIKVIEDVFEQQNYDVSATADALYNLRGINKVQSYAAIVSAQTRVAAQERELRINGPNVESLGHFPDLPGGGSVRNDGSRSQHKPRQQQKRHQKFQKQHQLRLKPNRLAKLNGRSPYTNAWERQDISTSTGVMESTISSELKIDRLKSILPSINRGVIQTTFYLNGCNSDATEAALRDVFNLPVPVIASRDIEDDEDSPLVEEAAQSYHYTETQSYASSRERVNAARDTLSERYCAVLDSFRRSNSILASDRVRQLSQARRDVRESQREAAHQYFLDHVDNLRQGRPIDLHGLIVMEALQIANEAIEFCRQERIKRCLLICGVGHHSVGGKARILTAIQLSLNRRQIRYKENHGHLDVCI